jgi:hypothetical protein
MPKFYAVLQSQTDGHQRFVTLSRVPCSACGGDPIARSRCKKCGGAGDEPATKESAVAHLEAQEREYAAFRLDENETIDRYPALRGLRDGGSDPLWVTEQHTLYVPDDKHLVDGRFVRGGKVLPNRSADPDAGAYFSAVRGWRAFHEQSKPYKVKSIGRVDEAGPKAAVTGGLYGVPIKNLMTGVSNGVWDWDTDTIKCALTTNSYTVDIDTHDFFNDVTNEVTGTGYTSGGATLASAAGTYDTASDQIRLDAADTTWSTSTITARRAVVYKSTGTASTSALISFLDFGADVTTTAGTFQITWDSTGIVVIDVT